MVGANLGCEHHGKLGACFLVADDDALHQAERYTDVGVGAVDEQGHRGDRPVVGEGVLPANLH